MHPRLHPPIVKIVLLAAAGLGNDVIAARLDTPRQIVSKLAPPVLLKNVCLALRKRLEAGGQPALPPAS